MSPWPNVNVVFLLVFSP